MTNQLIGEALTRPYQNVMRARQARARADYSDARTQQLPELMRLRDENQRARIAAILQRNQVMANNAAMRNNISMERLRQMKALLPFKMALLKAQAARAAQMGNGDSIQAQRLKFQSGMPFDADIGNGVMGKFQMPTQGTRTKMQAAIDAWPQLKTAMQQIQKGSKYYMSAPDKFEKYIAAVKAYGTGTATDKQEEMLKDAGISLDAITEAVETGARVMSVPRTNEGMEKLFGLFAPQKGQTPKSYAERQKALANNFEERVLQAQFSLANGMPLDNNAVQAMIQYVKANKGKNDFDFGGLADDADAGAGGNISEDEIKQLMKTYGVSREEVMKLLGE